MADNGQQSPQGFNPEDEIDEVFAHANPNPDRMGCPTAETLNAIAGGHRPVGDPAYEHLAKCSPCYREFRRIQQQNRRRTFSRRLLAVAAAVVILVAGGVYMVRQERSSPLPAEIANDPEASPQMRAELDLRNYSITRSEQDSFSERPLVLNRARLQVTIYLPVGSEPGRYELQILDGSLQSRFSGEVEATIRDFVTTIQGTFDLRALSPGSYRLAVRRQGDEWQFYPARIQ
jgi:hypothetical protein